nr:MAG: replication initiator protein [Microvirus sp.]
MPCFAPLHGWRSKVRSESGKRVIVFNPRDALLDMPIDVPCGQCIGCRLERSRQWAVRCVHEASLYEHNSFVTLTYDDDHVPVDRSLNVSHFQKFMKRLRKKFGNGVRYFHCGEYGENFGRPHYHACLFNFDVPDRELWSVRDGVRLYTSAVLSSLWPFGFVTIGDVTFESAAYVARYVLKKVTGEKSEDHYRYVSEITGQTYQRSPEYVTMSRRPGIGKGWIDKFVDDVFPCDFVVINGVRASVPRFYSNLYQELVSEMEFLNLKGKRVISAKAHSEDQTDDRLRTRGTVVSLRCEQQLIRNLT